MKKITSTALHQVWFICLSGLGGLLLSLMGISIGFIIGSLIIACILAFWHPKKLGISLETGLSRTWFQIGQCLVGIELGRNMNMTVMNVFLENWIVVMAALLSSIIFSLGTGYFLYRYSRADLLTGLLATSPGGVATMPSIAEEVGANIGVVSAVQAMRIFYVVTIIPIVLFFMFQGYDQTSAVVSNSSISGPIEFEWIHLAGTLVILLAALIGAFIGKRIKLPAPWLIGSLLGVIILETLFTVFTGKSFAFWWPHFIVIVGQILIGTSIGSRFRRSMFIGLKRILVVSTLGTLFLIVAMYGCAYLVSEWTGISLITSVLAFAPGGVVEMSTASVSLHADSTFVVAVQTLRLVVVILLMPSLFRFIHYRRVDKNGKVKTDTSSTG